MTLLQLHRSIERKLPLLVSALLVAVVVVLSGAAYVEVRRSARLVAIERLQRTARELGELFHRAAAQRVTELGTLASDSGIKAFAASGGRAARAPALRAMRGVARENLPNVAVEVWDPAGHLLLRAGDSTLPSAGPPPQPPRTRSPSGRSRSPATPCSSTRCGRVSCRTAGVSVRSCNCGA